MVLRQMAAEDAPEAAAIELKAKAERHENEVRTYRSHLREFTQPRLRVRTITSNACTVFGVDIRADSPNRTPDCWVVEAHLIKFLTSLERSPLGTLHRPL